ncbi:MAG: hypothetical protein SPJ71_01090 [Candidatus Limisoma sp.]|nr:hypothetical protein [Bacteroidales bacterium]MDY5893159.1 hypothetical protein [Candidatus Limisoma sp.]
MLSRPQTSLRHDADVHSFLSTLRSMASSGPQPCRRYGCGGCAGGTAIMGNPMLSVGDA